MKILHLFSNWKWTGPAEPALNLCKALSARHEVRLACGTAPFPGEPSEVGAKCRERGIAVVSGLRLRKHFRLWDNLHDWKRLRLLLREERFDLVHVHLPNDHLLAGLARRGLEPPPPLVRTFYGAEGPEPGVRSRLLLRRFTDGAIAVSELGRRCLVERCGMEEERTAVVPVGVDLVRFDPHRVDREGARVRMGFEPGDFVLGIVARMQRHRRFGVLFRAVRAAVDCVPALKLFVVGRGTNQEEVGRRPVADLGLEGVVRFSGYLEGDAYVEALAAMDGAVFLVPGTDGSCRAVREKMAMALPVIAADRPPLPEMVVHGRTGYLVPDTVEALAGAIQALAVNRDEAARMGAEARRRAERSYSLERQAREVEAFYRRILDA